MMLVAGLFWLPGGFAYRLTTLPLLAGRAWALPLLCEMEGVEEIMVEFIAFDLLAISLGGW